MLKKHFFGIYHLNLYKDIQVHMRTSLQEQTFLKSGI